MSQFKNITKEEFKELKNQVALVDFWAEWCGPCKIMEPILEEKVAPQFPQVTFLKVNTDEQQELAIEHGIRSIPNMILFQFDEEGTPTKLHSFIGVQDAFEMTVKINEILAGLDLAPADELAAKRNEKDSSQDNTPLAA
jgi:thioredoxin 1